MGKIKVDNFVNKTFFIVMHMKSLDKLGIDYGDWSDLDNIQKQLEDLFFNIGGIHYTSICCSAEGLYHIHDVCTLNMASRAKSIADKYEIDYEKIAKEFGQSHIELMWGTKEEACDYIEKRGKFEEKGEKVLRIFGDKENIQDNTGKRDGWYDELKEHYLDMDFSLKSFLAEKVRSRCIKDNIMTAYSCLLEEAVKRVRNCTVFYVEGGTKTGKTAIATALYPDAFSANFRSKDFPFDGYKGEKVLILDELRPGMLDVDLLFKILRGYPINMPIKGGYMPAAWNLVIITCMKPLDDWFKSSGLKVDKDMDDYREQFLSRISYHYKTRFIRDDTVEGYTGYSYWLPYEDYDYILDKDLDFDADWDFKLHMKNTETYKVKPCPFKVTHKDEDYPFV